MKFEWDENKNKSNVEKHKMTFDFASKVFEDEKRIEWEDKRKKYGETRWVTVGKVFSSIVTLIYTMRTHFIRIISARPSRKDERFLYKKKLKK